MGDAASWFGRRRNGRGRRPRGRRAAGRPVRGCRISTNGSGASGGLPRAL